jgi:uncharacterized protein (TIGR03435 family)
VTAAKQRSGHLYVQTKDLTVSVIGTVFLVNAEDAGSRVAVIQGEVQVRQGEMTKKLVPGEQVSTNPLMEAHPVIEQISWSRRAEEHLALLQQNAVTPPAAIVWPQFEVASIKVAVGARPSRIRCKGVDGELDVVPAGSTVPVVAQGRCIASSVPLLTLIATAYDLPLERVSWNSVPAGQATYQIDAKAEDSSSATQDQLRQMLQSMLADRFRLKVHRETREADGYVLSVAKGGVKFEETVGEEENAPKGRPSTLTPIIPLKGKFRMKRLADSLSTFVGRVPVIDKTDLRGIYDVSLVLTPLPNLSTDAFGARGRARMEFDPPLAKAIEAQLGLRLDSAKVPVEYLVVDSAEKPSDN